MDNQEPESNQRQEEAAKQIENMSTDEVDNLIEEATEAAEELRPEDVDMTLPVSRGEMVLLLQGISADVQSVVDQVSKALGTVMANQKKLDERLKLLEDPAKPRIYIP